MSRIKRILVPTDFSATSELAINYGIDMALRLGASLRVIHVLEEPSYAAAFPEGYYYEPPGFREQRIKDAQGRLLDAAARCTAARVDVTTQVVMGSPAATISEEALNRGADLIVMGTHGRSGVAHLLLGSVAERVVRMAPCPVLAVRETARVADTLAADRYEAVSGTASTAGR